MPSEGNSTRPLTPFEKYFWLSEEEKKNLKNAPRALTPLEAALQNPVKNEVAPAEPRNAIEKYFHMPKPEPPPRELTDVEKNFHAPKQEAPPRELTALEKYSNMPKPEPSPRELTDIEKIFHASKPEAPPKELTTTEKIFAAQRLLESVKPQPRPETPRPEPSSEPCDACGGTGRIVYPADLRGIVNRAPCNDCQGRGRIPKKD